jgi:outer membrane protein
MYEKSIHLLFFLILISNASCFPQNSIPRTVPKIKIPLPPLVNPSIFTKNQRQNTSKPKTLKPISPLKSLTLKETVALVLRHNRAIESAYLNRILEKFDLKVAQDEFQPDLTLSATTTAIRQADNETMTGQIGAEFSLKVPTGGQLGLEITQTMIEPWESFDESFANDLVLSFRQPLLRGSGVDVNMASQLIAERQEHKNILTLKQTLIDTLTQTIYTYRSFLLAQRRIDITLLSLARSQKLLEVNRALIAAGRMAEVDIIQAETDLANQELELRNNQNTAEQAQLSLLQLLDIDKHTMIDPIEPITVKPVNLNIAQLQYQALERRTDYLQALLELENAKTRLLLAENQQLWELDVIATYNIGTANDDWLESQIAAGRLQEGDYSVELGLRIPFGDLPRERELVAAQMTLHQANLNVQELKDNIELDILDAVRNIHIKWEQVKLAQRARELSKKQLDIELEKLKAGRLNNFQMVIFQNDLIQAENSEISAKIDYLNALTNLDALLGTTLERWGVNINTID